MTTPKKRRDSLMNSKHHFIYGSSKGASHFLCRHGRALINTPLPCRFSVVEDCKISGHNRLCERSAGAWGEPRGSLRVASGWLQGGYRLATRWLQGGFGVASGWLAPAFIIHHSSFIISRLGASGGVWVLPLPP